MKNENGKQEKKADDTTRDNKGKFIKGHIPLNPKDKNTGRFIKPVADEHEKLLGDLNE